jgi:hypothetical protein
MISGDNRLTLIDLGDALIPVTLSEAHELLQLDLAAFQIVLHKLFHAQPEEKEPSGVTRVRRYLEHLAANEWSALVSLNFNQVRFHVFSLICSHLSAGTHTSTNAASVSAPGLDAQWTMDIRQRVVGLCERVQTAREAQASLQFKDLSDIQRRFVHTLCEDLAPQHQQVDIQHRSANQDRMRVLTVTCTLITEAQ